MNTYEQYESRGKVLMIGPRVGFVCHLQNFNKWWATLRAKSLPSFFNRNLTLSVQPESFA